MVAGAGAVVTGAAELTYATLALEQAELARFAEDRVLAASFHQGYLRELPFSRGKKPPGQTWPAYRIWTSNRLVKRP